MADSPDIYSQLGNWLGGALQTGTKMYGQQNASQALTEADRNAVNTQNQFLGNVGNVYSHQTSLGNNAMDTLGSTLGVGGKPADYSNFMNMPGYQFAVQQGTQALQRQAAAMGNAYTPNTAAAVGQYVTGTAMQDYNNYVQQLQQAAGLGAQANQSLGNITYNTGSNISQLQQNMGQAEAGKYTGMGQSGSQLLGGGGYGSGGGLAGGVGSMIGSGLRSLFGGGGGAGGAAGAGGIIGGLRSLFGGGGGLGAGGVGDINTGTYDNGGYLDAGGTYIDPSDPNYNGGAAFNSGNTAGDMNTGYDNSQTDYSQSDGAYGGP